MQYEQQDLFSGRQSRALSVSDALLLAKDALEGLTVTILGEVSEVSNKPGYKAVYFTIKDARSALPCMMWNNRYAAAGISLRVGSLVEVSGRFTLYAAKGRMNFEVFSVTLAGEGDLRLKVANLARKLEAEGLMAPARKRPIPEYPQRIGVVTSPRGAAIKDVLRTLRRRFPLATVLVAGVPVEGAQAPLYLRQGLAKVVEEGAEVVLLVRGGGSYEDLMPFNDEALARPIASLPIPVITGIGHEPDTSIADMVADLRSSTPTAAAENVVPATDEILTSLLSFGKSLKNRAEHIILRAQTELDRVRANPIFSEPARLLSDYWLGVDDLAQRLSAAIPNSLKNDEEKLSQIRQRLALFGSRFGIAQQRRLDAVRLSVPLRDPGRMLEGPRRDVEGLGSRLLTSLPKSVSADRAQIEAARQSLMRSMSSFGTSQKPMVARLSEKLADDGRRIGEQESSQCDFMRHRLVQIGSVFCSRFARQISFGSARLEDLSPLTILSRGYSITHASDGAIIRSVEQVDADDQIIVNVNDGDIHARVEYSQKIITERQELEGAS
ncbi:MAG: exodeoxyribonuclease VII large subunit [Eggerthellaceae bacterium]|nr:exodeoxyribonuclease VII large subunit [Eggerthellaceae bacterium]